MKQNIILKFFITGLLLLLQIFIFAGDTAVSKDDIVFKWAFIQSTGKDKSGNDIINVMDFSKEVKVKSADLFAVYIQPVQNAYIYLFHYGPNDELALLFPNEFKEFDNKNYMKNTYYLPNANGSDEAFQLDEAKGTERFLLIVSKTRLTSLEKLTQAYIDQTNSNAAGKIAESKLKILDEIKKIKIKNSKYVVLAEKPSPMAATARGLKNEAAKNAIQVVSKNFYERTFRLTHE